MALMRPTVSKLTGEQDIEDVVAHITTLANWGSGKSQWVVLIGSLVWWLCRHAHHIRAEHERASAIVDGTLLGPLPSDEPIANRRPLSLVDVRGE